MADSNKNDLLEVNNSGLLIDLSSPTNKEDKTSAVPLIPGPQLSAPVIFSNPFDTIASQAENLETNDPFEMVFKSAFCTPVNNISANVNKTGNEPKDGCSDNIKDNLNTVNNIIDDKTNSKISSSSTSSSSSKSNDEKVKIPSSDKINNINEITRNSSLSSLDLSTSDEMLRASIAKRINKCMERVLNNTFDKYNRSNSEPLIHQHKQNFNRTSSSVFISKNNQECIENEIVDKQLLPLKLIFSPQPFAKSKSNVTEISPISKVKINDTRVSMQSQSIVSNDFNKAFLFDGSKSSGSATEITGSKTKAEDSSFNDNLEDDVFVAAKKVANTISKVATSFSCENLKDDSGDDLLSSLQPQWDPIDSSDEETDLLRNDPALNLKFKSGSLEQLPTPKKSVEFSDAVIQYKKRRSLDLNSSLFSATTEPLFQETNQLKRSNSFDGSSLQNEDKTHKITNKQPKPVSDRLIKKNPAPVPVPQQAFSQKLKAKKPQTDVINKKGPLKAVIPLQNMTKGVKKKDSPKERLQNSHKVVQNGYSTPKKNKKIVSPKPVACSTPNKIMSAESSPASSPIMCVNISDPQHQSFNAVEDLKREENGITKIRSASLTSIPNHKESPKTKLNSSGPDLKKKSIKLSQLPRIKPLSALSSRHGNQSSQSRSLSQSAVPQNIDKLPLKLSLHQRGRNTSIDKENIVPT